MYIPRNLRSLIYTFLHIPLTAACNLQSEVNMQSHHRYAGKSKITQSSQKCEKKQFPRLSAKVYSNLSTVKSGTGSNGSSCVSTGRIGRDWMHFSPYYPNRVILDDRRHYRNPAFINLSIFALFGNHCYTPRWPY